MNHLKTGGKALLSRLNIMNYAIWIWFALAIITGQTSFSANSFARQLITTGFFVLGAGLEMLLGDIDLCFMAQAAISTVMAAKIYQITGSITAAFAVILVAFILTGLLKGFAISRLGIPSVILTFALQMIFINLWPSTDSIILNVSTSAYYQKIILCAGIIFVLSALFQVYLLKRTYWGKYCTAIGENIAAVRESGVNTVAIYMVIHAIAAIMFFLGTAMLLFVAPYGGTNRDGGYAYQIIAAASLGGAAVDRRGAETTGLIVGAISIVLLQQLVTVFNLNAYLQIVQGAIILLAFFERYHNKTIRNNQRAEKHPPKTEISSIEG